ncbi:uncharacterized protein TNCV_1905611 [Trichonephila clavipes]|nr:uncharacterized protein TNCV_1905611 [Trichonephila clavipes]
MVYWASLPCKSLPSLKAFKSRPSSISLPVSCRNSLEVTDPDKVLDANAIGLSEPSGYTCDRTQPIPTGDASLAKVNGIYTLCRKKIYAPRRNQATITKLGKNVVWMPVRRNRRQYEQLTDFDRGRIIGLREAG